MSRIQISNLQPAGVELFQGSESFLTELQATEAHKIHGGSKKKKSGSKKKKSGSKKRGSNNSGNFGGPVVFVPIPYYPCMPRPCGC
jgi:hypothetical protein